MIDELGVRDVLTSLVHCSLVAALRCWIAEVIPEPTSHVAGLVDGLASDYVQDECITWDLLVLLDFDDVSGLNACPVKELERLAPLIEDKLLDRLLVNNISRLLQLLIMKVVDKASSKKTHYSHCNDVRVGSNLIKSAAEVHDKPLYAEDTMVCDEEQVIEEYEETHNTLHTRQS